MKNLILSAVVILFVVFIFSGCTSSTLVSTWKEPGIKAESLNKVFVICVNNNSTKRRIWEDELANSLRANGIKAVPSYKEFPKAAPDEKELGEFLGNKFDAVIMTHKVNEEQNKYRTPGVAMLTPAFVHRTHFFHSYATVYHEVYIPGRIEKEKIYQIETSIYEPKEDGKLLWSIITETRNPKSTSKFSGETAEIVMKNLTKDGFLPQKD